MNALKYAVFPVIIISVLVLFGIFSMAEDSNTVLASVSPQPEKPSRRDLYNALRDHGKLLIIHDAKDDDELKVLAKMASTMTDQRRWKLSSTLKNINEVTDDEIMNNPIFLIGSHKENEWIRKLSKQLPLGFQDSSFVFQEKKYTQQGDVFKLSFYPHPFHDKFPMFLITGNDPSSLHQNIIDQSDSRFFNIIRNAWSYEILRQGKAVVFGQFDEKKWTIDQDLHFDFSDSEASSYNGKHISFISYSKEVREAHLQELSANCEQTFEEILSFIGQEDKTIPVRYFIYPTVEEKGLRVQSMDEAQIELEEDKVHVVINNNFAGHLWQMENEVVLRNLLGKPQTQALQLGLGVYFTKQWQKKGYAFWAKRLYESDNLPSLKELLDNEMLARDSDLIMYCSAGSFVAYLIEEWGKETFLEKYKSWKPSEKEIRSLEKGWHHFLKKQEEASVESQSKKLPFLKGFNFSHEGYSIYNGYGSSLASKSLEKLSSLNANAVAIVPYSGMRDPKKPSFIGFSNRAGNENDESVAYAHYEAQKNGILTVMKPQIWIGRGSWPGDVEMSSEEDWQQFFDHYHRWMRHYAMLAEIHGFDMLCVGVEFAKATIAREKDWRELIGKLRGIYSGPMTYAANWGEEFENLKFWDELDYIGLDCYYPLSKKEKPEKEELDQHFKKVLSLIESKCRKFNKPMLFTEIGFRSVEGTWTQPHEQALGRPFNEYCQKICYEVVLENLKGKDFCNGILWWKWSCNLNNRGPENTGFTPYNKMAQQTVNEWFSRL